MNVRPLIIRELRAEARRANTYWLRALAAALLTALFVWSAWNFQGGNALGPLLFETLSQGLLLAVLTIVAGITADTISSEKREGTLGLLFLTPLTARDIVVGKTLLHALRAVSLFIAVVPIVSLPFLLGGISSASLYGFACALPTVVLIAVASGIIASVRCREWIESIVWAEIYAALFCGLFIVGEFLFDLNWVAASGMGIIYAAYVLWCALAYASSRLKNTWQEEITETESWWVKIFSTSDFWRSAFHWDAKKARDRNPIAWLQEYNWSSRLTKWGWCALIFFAQWKLIFGWRQFMEYQLQIYSLLAVGIAFSAAASFRRERQTGALELLLVTPISAGNLILGRLQGVWFHFFPAIAILAAVWTMGPPQYLSLPLWAAWYLAGAYFCLPIIGFYCSLLTSNVLVSWLITIVVGQFLPFAITQAFRFDIGRRNVPFVFFLIQAVFAIIAGILLYENLIKRRFVLKP